MIMKITLIEANQDLGVKVKALNVDGGAVVTSVPATADNSNMTLWSLLFVAFAAVAVITAKKRKA